MIVLEYQLIILYIHFKLQVSLVNVKSVVIDRHNYKSSTCTYREKYMILSISLTGTFRSNSGVGEITGKGVIPVFNIVNMHACYF